MYKTDRAYQAEQHQVMNYQSRPQGFLSFLSLSDWNWKYENFELFYNKANLRDLIAATGLESLTANCPKMIKSVPNCQFFNLYDFTDLPGKK